MLYGTGRPSWSSEGIQLFDSRPELRRGLSAYTVYRACGQLEAQIAASTWNQPMSILSLFYGWAEDEGFTAAVPFADKQAVTAYGDQARMQSVNLQATDAEAARDGQVLPGPVPEGAGRAAPGQYRERSTASNSAVGGSIPPRVRATTLSAGASLFNAQPGQPRR